MQKAMCPKLESAVESGDLVPGFLVEAFPSNSLLTNAALGMCTPGFRAAKGGSSPRVHGWMTG